MDRPGDLDWTSAANRFAAALGALIEDGKRFGLAVSGGPDSLALLLLAEAAFPGRFEVATVDHGLRPESAGEAETVAAFCARRGLSHATLRAEVSRQGNLQANARAARYAALGEWAELRGLSALVTAHHADDQAETLLMRLNRGAGVRGLAAMRAVACVPGHPQLPLLRPLLGWRKAELEAIVADAGLTAARDPSNADPRFERAALRQTLAAVPWLEPAALAASAAHLGEADEALEWVASALLAQAELSGETIVWEPADTPRALALRVLERIVAHLGTSKPRGAEIARWHDALAQGRIATLAGIRGDGQGSELRFTRAAPPRRKT